MYLILLHGRKNPKDYLSDWGIDGPAFKVDYLHWTYGQLDRISFSPDIEFFIGDLVEEDLFYYDGVYYGDFIIDSTAPENRIENFDTKKIL